MKPISVTPKKRGRPATGRTPRVGVRLPDDIRHALEAYAADIADGDPNVSEAMRDILADALRDKGYLPKSE